MITLTKDMEVGVPKIDAQHKELIDRINKVTYAGANAVSKEETQKTLDFLSDYVRKHFYEEEELQLQSNYPKYEMHKKLHALYIENLDKLKAEFATNGASLKFTIDLNTAIIDWIIKHIKQVDVEFGRYYQSAGK